MLVAPILKSKTYIGEGYWDIKNNSTLSLAAAVVNKAAVQKKIPTLQSCCMVRTSKQTEAIETVQWNPSNPNIENPKFWEIQTV